MIDAAAQGVLGLATFALSLRLTSEHTPQTPWWRRIAGIGYGAFGLWLLGMLLSSSLPVVKDMEVQVLNVGPTWAVMSVSATKPSHRRDCIYLYTRASVLDASGRSAKAWWESLDDPAPGSTRPAGRQWMGDWRVRWDARAGFVPVSVVYEVHHDCGFMGGDVTTTTGPFPLS